MKHHIFLGIHESRKTACILTCLLPFDQLDANDLSSQDFRHDSTNWNGCDDISRTLKLRNLRLTGREIILPKPIVFRDVDPDMGHHYNWTYPVSIIAETEMTE